MKPLREHGPVHQNDLMFNGWLSAMLGLIVKAQAGAGLRPVAGMVTAPIHNDANGARVITRERTAHGDLASRG